MKPNFQKTGKEFRTWIDEAGVKVPVDRLTKSEKLAEKSAEKLYKQAIDVNNRLSALKDSITEISREVMEAVYEQYGQDPEGRKGNFTWFNFDRSLKVEVDVNVRTDFDEQLIQLCQNKLNQFLEESIDTKDGFIKQFVTDAFSKSRGALDAKKVMGLLKYRQKVSNPLFQEAITLLESSIRYPDSKRYFRVFVRDSEGAYQAINLNFSSI